MATLVERYSSLSVKSCLSPGDQRPDSKLLADPMVDLPLLDRGQRCFAVPPGIEVCKSHVVRYSVYCSPTVFTINLIVPDPVSFCCSEHLAHASWHVSPGPPMYKLSLGFMYACYCQTQVPLLCELCSCQFLT